ncbi:transaldolase family protein [Cellulomonas cellasea]|uniref:Transaldolase n=1 Tax=Cellulomonas cellasea TaxID=43670 RepID=A0A7W4UBQ6_9CELL|nr:transaldolase family protein [Cellulomonas cellasea]MBB2921253.1 transaldolase [Cellulomonas cellasea]
MTQTLDETTTTAPAPTLAPGVETALGRMTRAFPQTALWNDSAQPGQLRRSIEFGAVGATCNPVIALAAVRADLPRWTARIRQLADERPAAGESELGWAVVQELSVDAAALLEPAFEAHQGRNGRLSIQTSPRLHRDARALVEQAVQFDALAPNIIVKIPATATGIEAMEEATYRGVSINATVSFTVAQAVAVAEAVERGVQRREREGLPVEELGSVATIMGGRLDDWLKSTVARAGTLVDPGVLDWAGVAALKRAHEIFTERGYRTRVLSAAFRNHLQLTELVGGDLVVSPPFDWQDRINANDLDLPSRIDVPVDPEIIATLERLVPDFRRAHEPDGLSVEEFEAFGPTRRTLRQFLAADAELELLVRDVLVPEPR